MSKPRILFLVQLPPPIHGVSVINQRIVESDVVNSAFDVSVLPIRFSDTIEDIDRFSAGKALKSVALLFSLLWQCLFHRPDLVYFTLSPVGNAFYRDVIYVALLRLLRVPRVIHLHRIGITEQGAGSFRRMLYRLAFGGAGVIHLSPSLYDDIADYVDRGSCRFVSNGIDDPLPGGPIERNDGDTVNITFLSHMVPGKGPVILLESLVELQRRGVDFRATFAGGRVSAEWVAAWDKYVIGKPLEEKVRYIGEIHGEDKDRFYRESGIFVFPSIYDSFGIVILEAMSYAVPVVASRQGSVPDIVLDNKTGLIFEKGSIQALADKLEKLVADPIMRKSMGMRARERFEVQFTSRVFEESLVQALRDFLDGVPAALLGDRT